MRIRPPIDFQVWVLRKYGWKEYPITGVWRAPAIPPRKLGRRYDSTYKAYDALARILEPADYASHDEAYRALTLLSR